jgi:threonyl-tRNA synthetase
MSEIQLRLPDGQDRKYASGITGQEVAEKIGSRLAKDALAIKIDGQLQDLNVPVERSAAVEIVTFNSLEGRETYWHSTSHLMAHAVKQLFPQAKLAIGPAIEEGFYYDFDLERPLTPEDLVRIEKKMSELAKAGSPIKRKNISKAEALSFFNNKGESYKVELISELPEGDVISIYEQDDFADLCRGPHVPSTSKIKAFKLLSIAGAYWRGSEKNKMLQRIYGVTFPTKQEMDQHLFRLEEAKRRDHRKLGPELDLFLLTPKVGGGLPLWLPKGTVIREELENFLKTEQRKRGYLPVVTPHIGNINLYKTSGHYPYYKDSQFTPLQVEDEEYLLKPMNCPHHFQIYAAKPRSYRDLPIRLAEFGTCYRYEQSGELNGLIRVRAFTVDDSHMFVRQDQLKEELKGVIDLIQLVFTTLGLSDFKTRLSFRDPKNKDKYGGEDAMWVQAEKDIQEAADEMKLNYYVGMGEAAFYGPKIDFMVRDVLARTWQLGTVQVDYVMPERFDLEYTGADGQKHRPVVIHRAPFGSMERFIGVLIEHFAAEFPLWLAPVQAAILPITDQHQEYARQIYEEFKAAGVRAELDDRNEKVGYKIRDWELKKVPYMLIVGEKEQASNTVSVRQHKKGDLGSVSREAFLSQIIHAIQTKSLTL